MLSSKQEAGKKKKKKKSWHLAAQAGGLELAPVCCPVSSNSFCTYRPRPIWLPSHRFLALAFYHFLKNHLFIFAWSDTHVCFLCACCGRTLWLLPHLEARLRVRASHPTLANWAPSVVCPEVSTFFFNAHSLPAMYKKNFFLKSEIKTYKIC